MKRAAWLILTILVTWAFNRTPLQAQPVAQGDLPAWCVAVWYPSAEAGGLDSLRANMDEIGVIHPFWYTPAADGTIIPGASDAEDADLLAEWRADGLTIIPSIFSGASQLVTDPDVRAFHIEQIVQLVERMDYDGIDIDYESFPLESREGFSIFIEELSHRLHGDGKLLTIAVHAKTSDAGEWESAEAQDWRRIAPAVDALTIMAYDYTNRNEPPGAIAPLPWVREVLAYAARVTDLGKVRLGLPFYAYRWQRERPPATTIDWMAAQRVIEAFAPEVQRDPTNREAFIRFKARGLPSQTIYFADSVALEYKLQGIMVEFPALGGVAIWGIGGEDPANWDVLRAARTPNCDHS